ncbi:carboxypeptidase regulatory-like domain-containing protein [candidate division KSB1 bacterium]|nr:carboxypeptidase regulatory-like domain-containing protein [candidate division KSB1 bacterium]
MVQFSQQNELRKLIGILLIFLFIFAISCDKRKHSNPFDPYYEGNNLNTAPVALFQVTPDTGFVNTNFFFDASASHDTEDTTVNLQYRWDWENNNTFDTNFDTLAVANHVFTTAGLKTVKLEVKDSGGLTNTTTRNVLVQDGATGDIRGSVFDGVTQLPIADVRVGAINHDGDEVKSVMTASDGSYLLRLGSGQTYSLSFLKAGFIDMIYHGITVEASQILYLEALYQISMAYSGSGSITGELTNAINGEGIENVTIDVRQGINVRSGSIVTSATTNQNGQYQLNVDAGNYTAQASHPDFNTTFFTLTSIGGQTQVNINTSMSPRLAEGEIRIILTWGDTPYDLDSHLTGPIPGNTTRFHVFYSDEGSRDSSPFTFLDHDDTQQFGPETITIVEQFDGVYRYSVHDFSNRDSNSSLVLSTSGAKVEIYEGSNLLRTFYVPNNTGGTLWTVFEMNQDTITPINTMTYVSDPDAVQKRTSTPSDIDPIFFDFDFPDK